MSKYKNFIAAAELLQEEYIKLVLGGDFWRKYIEKRNITHALLVASEELKIELYKEFDVINNSNVITIGLKWKEKNKYE